MDSEGPASPPFRRLPPVNAVLDRPSLADAIRGRGREAVVGAVRAAIERAREALRDGGDVAIDVDELARLAGASLADDGPRLRPVLNATGILLHTGLGRAPLAAEAAEAVARVARGYCNLEIDLDTGDRGRRADGVAELLRRLTGAEAATVVNNNAGATVLVLRALAAGKEVVVSRGQLVEIGGSFRLPEIFGVSGARLREVGTTNRTRLEDYAKAIGPETAALLRVHASNYRIVGFAEEVPIGPLARLAAERGLAAIDDVGSGALAPGRPNLPAAEPTIAEGLAVGADVVLASGDKLLGGPQCGLIVGKSAAIARVERDPLMRALRVDKLTLAALEATLRLALAGRDVPLWSFLDAPIDSLRDRAGRLAESLRADPGLDATAVDSTAFLGGGSVPAESLPSAAVRLVPPAIGREADLARALRLGDPSVFPRVHAGAVLLDLRALPEADDPALLAAVRRILPPSPAGSGSALALPS
ncbi:MAG TPA: L-seryl-tRNA(Sec) selenium transferase [Isosphaeraceae bacterium]|jgi:L-seryl-tRNA(Ser) seleniumtransferase|nr:L-seryl-tRNA(Sec) selenium transferase [Isosphaeraceae bacterium]